MSNPIAIEFERPQNKIEIFVIHCNRKKSPRRQEASHGHGYYQHLISQGSQHLNSIRVRLKYIQYNWKENKKIYDLVNQNKKEYAKWSR